MARQGFGGNLDVALQSAQVRDLLELYAMSTGQAFGGFNPIFAGARLVQQGGAVQQLAQFRGARPFVFESSVPSVSTPVAERPIVLQLDGRATEAFLQGQAVETMRDNPCLVATAAGRAQQESFGRRSTAVRQLEPDTVLA